MQIKRGGKNYKLSEQEMTRVYYEMQARFMRQDVERQLSEACEKLSISIPRKVWKQLVDKSLALYQKHDSNDEGWYYNCRCSISEAAVETQGLAKRTAKRLASFF